jgi:hypothetical protein
MIPWEWAVVGVLLVLALAGALVGEYTAYASARREEDQERRWKSEARQIAAEHDVLRRRRQVLRPGTVVADAKEDDV